jgi:hypothetical protein
MIEAVRVGSEPDAGISTETAGGPALVTVAEGSTRKVVPLVVTRTPFGSVPVQVVVPFAAVGSGAHCAAAGLARPAPSAIALTPNKANARGRTPRAENATIMFRRPPCANPAGARTE